MNVFHVLTEFRFEAGSAILESSKLQGAVEGVSQAADDALLSFQKLGFGVAAQFGLGAGGMLGLFSKALFASDKFTQSQLAFANVIADSSVPFLDRMKMSADTMARINQLANEFALPADELLSFTKVLGPLLQAKGLAGPNFSNAIDISRNLLKSAPTLGIDPTLVQGQLLRLIEGQASTGDTLFNRLGGDTKAFKPFLGNSKKFNTLPEAERVKTLQRALKEFASDTNVLTGNVRTLRGQMQLLNDAIGGAFSILKPLGDALMKPIIDIFVGVNAFLRKEGAQIFQSFGRAIAPFISDPRTFLITMLQLRQLKKDMDLTATIFKVAGALLGLNYVLNLLSIRIPVVSSGLGFFAGMIEGLSAFLSRNVFVLGASTGVLNGFFAILSKILAPLLLIVFVFQLLSRAMAIAKVRDMENLVKMSPMIADLIARFANMWALFQDGFQVLAEFIAPLFQMTFWFEILAGVLDMVSILITLVVGGFQGLAFAIFEFVSQMQSLLTGGGFSFSSIGEAFDSGIEDILNKVLGRVDSGQGGIANNVTNINKVEINNQFKEQLEPDRIAFTLKEQLLKAAQNRGQAAGGSLASPLVAR